MDTPTLVAVIGGALGILVSTLTIAGSTYKTWRWVRRRRRRIPREAAASPTSASLNATPTGATDREKPGRPVLETGAPGLSRDAPAEMPTIPVLRIDPPTSW